MRPLAALPAAVLLAIAASPVTAAASPPTAAPADCSINPGVPATGAPWAQTRLGFQRVWPVTTGAGVTVAVIDTGVDAGTPPRGATFHPQLRGIHVLPGRNVVTSKATGSTLDCDGHGTMVTSIIAAQPVPGQSFVGIAPGVTILPIKQTDSAQDKGADADGIARGIEAAVAAHAKVANLSVFVLTPSPSLEQAVADADRAGLVLVAAAGNNGQKGDPRTYPAAYSTKYPNVISVGATDQQDVIAPFSEYGDYVDIAAPGAQIEMASPLTGYVRDDGTSFAAPFVTGTVALMRAANPRMSPAQIRDQLEATADAPPATVPDPHYGFGIVNPYLAVTSVRAGAAAPASTPPARPIPVRAAPAPPDRHVQHLALAAAAALLGLAALVIAGAAVLRGPRRRSVA